MARGELPNGVLANPALPVIRIALNGHAQLIVLIHICYAQHALGKELFPLAFRRERAQM